MAAGDPSPHSPVARYSFPGAGPRLLRSLVVAVLVLVCIVQAWVIVFDFHIGPVVATLDGHAGRGVHLGDLLAVPLVAIATLLAARAVPHRGTRGSGPGATGPSSGDRTS